MVKYLLFVYGTLKKGYPNHHLLQESRFIDEAVTKKKYALYNSGIPFLIKYESISYIHGEVYEIDDNIIKKVDALEGHPDWYKREKIEVVLSKNYKYVRV
jgi:gamma-glutamylaminecyclotransferase